MDLSKLIKEEKKGLELQLKAYELRLELVKKAKINDFVPKEPMLGYESTMEYAEATKSFREGDLILQIARMKQAIIGAEEKYKYTLEKENEERENN